jgi:hypothetical protein
MSNPMIEHMHRKRTQTFSRYEAALRDLIANPGMYGAMEWSTKNGINRSAASPWSSAGRTCGIGAATSNN